MCGRRVVFSGNPLIFNMFVFCILCSGKKFATHKIVLLTPFTATVDEDNYDAVVQAMDTLKIELIAM